MNTKEAHIQMIKALRKQIQVQRQTISSFIKYFVITSLKELEKSVMTHYDLSISDLVATEWTK